MPQTPCPNHTLRVVASYVLDCTFFAQPVDPVEPSPPGKSMEEDFGTLRLGAVYLLSGLSGNLLSASFLPLQITVGAFAVLLCRLGRIWGMRGLCK